MTATAAISTVKIVRFADAIERPTPHEMLLRYASRHHVQVVTYGESPQDSSIPNPDLKFFRVDFQVLSLPSDEVFQSDDGFRANSKFCGDSGYHQLGDPNVYFGNDILDNQNSLSKWAYNKKTLHVYLSQHLIDDTDRDVCVEIRQSSSSSLGITGSPIIVFTVPSSVLQAAR